MNMAERIRQARRRAKLSQAKLAELIKVQRSAVSNWESASGTYPTMPNLIAIARACGVALEWLGTGRGTMTLEPDSQSSILAVDVDIVELASERELLASFRALPHRFQAISLELIRTLERTTSKGR